MENGLRHDCTHDLRKILPADILQFGSSLSLAPRPSQPPVRGHRKGAPTKLALVLALGGKSCGTP
jgi:hypothetical protein